MTQTGPLVGDLERGPVPDRPTLGAGFACWRGEIPDPVAAQTALEAIRTELEDRGKPESGGSPAPSRGEEALEYRPSCPAQAPAHAARPAMICPDLWALVAVAK
jgi:hypothetical protein